MGVKGLETERSIIPDMKALTLLQPWASLMAMGEKQWETRSWRCSYRGEMAITASAKMKTEDAMLVLHEEPFKSAIHCDPTLLPLGCVVAVGTLETIITSENWIERFEDKACGTYDREIPFGNYDIRRFAWHFINMVKLPEPVPCRGLQMVWNLPGSVEAEVRKQLARAKS